MAAPADPRPPESGPPDFVLGELDLPQGEAAAAQAPERAQPPESAPRRGHRRRAAAPAAPSGPRPVLLRVTDPVLRWGPPALLALSPLAWGSVEAWSEALVVAGAALVGGTWALRLAAFPERCAAERAALSHGRSWSSRLLPPLVALVAVGLAQLLPLGALVGTLSPVAAQIELQAGRGSSALTFSLAAAQTARSLALLTALGLLFLAVADGLPGRAEARRLAAILVALGFAHAVGGILWHYQGPGRAYWEGGRSGAAFGPYVNRNHFAGLMGMTLPFGVGWLLALGNRRRPFETAAGASARAPAGTERGSQRLLAGFAVAVMAGALGLSLSRGGVVSALAALAALCVAVGAARATRPHLWKAAAAVAAALGFAVWLAAGPLIARLGSLASLLGSDAESAPRTRIWADGLRLAADFPLLGAGFGAFADAYPRYQSAHAGLRVVHAHNDWLQLLAEGGLAGSLAVLAVLAAYVAAATRLLGRRRDREVIFLGLGGLAGLLAFLLHCGVEFNARIPANALWFSVLAGLTLRALSSRMHAGP